MKSLRRVGLKKGQDLATQHPSAQLPGVLRNINIPFREALKKDNNSLIRTTSNAHVSARSLRNHNRIPGRTNSFCDSLQDLRRRSPKRDLGARRTDKSNVPATMGRPRPQHSLKATHISVEVSPPMLRLSCKPKVQGCYPKRTFGLRTTERTHLRTQVRYPAHF